MTVWHIILILLGVLYFIGECFKWEVKRKNYGKDPNYELVEHKMFTWESSNDCLVASVMVFKHKNTGDFVFDHYPTKETASGCYYPEEHKNYKAFLSKYQSK